VTPLFLVALTGAAAVVAGLVLALRRLQKQAIEEQVERAVFDDFDRKLAASPPKR